MDKSILIVDDDIKIAQIKSGFTDEAGYCLVSSASDHGKSVLAVVLNSTEEGVWEDSRMLLQLGFEAVN